MSQEWLLFGDGQALLASADRSWVQLARWLQVGKVTMLGDGLVKVRKEFTLSMLEAWQTLVGTVNLSGVLVHFQLILILSGHFALLYIVELGLLERSLLLPDFLSLLKLFGLDWGVVKGGHIGPVCFFRPLSLALRLVLHNTVIREFQTLSLVLFSLNLTLKHSASQLLLVILLKPDFLLQISDLFVFLLALLLSYLPCRWDLF